MPVIGKDCRSLPQERNAEIREARQLQAASTEGTVRYL
jgi:hypothetical protein